MKCVMNLFKDPQLKFEDFKHGKYVGSSADISKLWDTKKLGFHLETLEPGAYSCPYHLHHQEEEMFLVLKGSAMVRQDGDFYTVKDGDLILFKTGSAHQFYNHTKESFLFLALSNVAENEVCEYPDSRKMWVRNEKKLTQDGKEVSDYWLDEENPDQYWPKDIVPT